MADTVIKPNQVYCGTYGRVWINETLLGNVKKFEAKKKAVYEDFDLSEKMSKSRKIVGLEVSGTISLTKVDSFAAKLLSDAWDKGITPEIKIVSRVLNPDTNEEERVTITGVTFDEITHSFEVKKILEEELSFEAEEMKFA